MKMILLLNHWRIPGFVLVAGVILGGCVSTADLAKHPLDGKSVVVVSEIPEAPFADFNMTIFDRVGQEAPMAPPNGPPPTGLGDIVLERTQDEEAPHPRTRTHALMDSVLADFVMSEQVIEATKQRMASAMRFNVVDDGEEADYRLEIKVDDYGIGADAWHSTVYFEVTGRLKLIDNVTNRKVWEGEVMDIAPLTRALISVGIPANDLETPAALGDISYGKMREVLIGLVGYAAVQLNAPFQEAYYRTLDREEARL